MAFPTYKAGTKNKGHGDPFVMLSNDSFPTDYVASLDHSAYLYFMNGIYQEVTKRVVAHFVTDIEFNDASGDTEEQKNHKSMLVDSMDIFQAMQTLGMDHAAYGVAIHRIHFPFHRFLVDKRGGNTKYYNVNDFPRDKMKFDPINVMYEVPDPRMAKKNGTWDKASPIKLAIKDIFVRDKDKIRLVPLDPRYCRFDYGQTSKRLQVVYQFDPEHKNDILSGNLFAIGETHSDLLHAICRKKDFRFEDDAVFVFTDTTITGISKKGIGIPKAISHYRELYQLQLYRKIDEMVAKDYMLPIRLFSPGYGSGSGTMDPTFMQAGREWKANMAEVVKRHRQEGDTFFAVPYATQYQEASGNGKELTPKEHIEWQTTSLLNALGYPAELFNCTLAYQQVPNALRLFERAQHFIPHNLEKYLRWVNRKTCDFLKIQHYDVSLAKPRIADDMEKSAMLSQLVQAGEIPREYLFKELGLENSIEIYKKRLREDTDQEFARVDQQAELEQKAQSPGQGSGQGAGQAGEGSGTPLDGQKKAMEKAEEWAQMDESSRRADMEAVRTSDVSLHALAQKFLEQIRTKAEGEGRNQSVNPN